MTRKESAEKILENGHCGTHGLGLTDLATMVNCGECFLYPKIKAIVFSGIGMCEHCKYIYQHSPSYSPLRARILAASYLGELEEETHE